MLKPLITSFIIGAVIGALIYSRYAPPKTEIKTETKEVIRNDIITKTVTIQAPTGETRTETVVVDKSTKKETMSLQQIEVKEKQYRLSLLSNGQKHAAGIEYRVLGPLSVGVQVQSDMTVFLGVSYAF